MGIFRRSAPADASTLYSAAADVRGAYTTEPATDPESGEPCIALRSNMTGGHVVSLHDTQEEADDAADTLAAHWNNLRR